MKKQAVLCKNEALCFLFLVLLLPLTAEEEWCAFGEHAKWAIESLQKKIDELKDNLLPSIVQYEVLTEVDAKKLEKDCCFIGVTVQQLNNSFTHLLNNFRDNTSNYKVTQEIRDQLLKVYSDSNGAIQCSQSCLKPTAEIVTGCTNGMFAYVKAILNHSNSIIGHCLKQAQAKNFSFSEDLSTFCLINLINGSYSNNFSTNFCSQNVPNASLPQPSSSLAHPTQTTIDNGSSKVTVTEGKSLGPTINKNMSIAKSPHHDVNISQTASSNGGAASEAQSHITSAAIGKAETAKVYEDGEPSKKNIPVYSVIIASSLGIIIVILCIYTVWKIKMQRMNSRNYHVQVYELEVSNNSLGRIL